MASFSVSCPKNSALFNGSQPGQNQNNQQPHCSVSFQSNSPALLAGSSLRLTGSKHSQPGVCKVSQLNEVALKKSSNSVPVPETKVVEEPEEKSAAETTVPDASAISAFMTQAADLIKLVDSRDIMELHLKQLDCELIIRKKEALQPQEVAAPVYMMQPPHPQSHFPQQAAAPAPAAAAPSPPPASASAPTSPPKPKSSHPPLKCPMAGTFYRSPAPGAPAFVKVGDKVQKGQVVCIIEAMKLMNEIEADQSGTLTEILVDDGKPVSLDTPLFVIEP